MMMGDVFPMGGWKGRPTQQQIQKSVGVRTKQACDSCNFDMVLQLPSMGDRTPHLDWTQVFCGDKGCGM